MKFAQLNNKPSSSRISMTPLIDVVFILLLFFMLTSTFVVRRNMDLATPSISSVTDTTDEVIRLELNKDGLTFEGQLLTLDDIHDLLNARLTSGDPVNLSIGEGVPLAATVEVMDALKASGGRAIALQTVEVTQ